MHMDCPNPRFVHNIDIVAIECQLNQHVIFHSFSMVFIISLGECREAMVLFMECMRRNEFASHQCRDLSKAYLKCRMDNELMAKEDLSKLGFQSQPRPD